ncbi:MAG: hypothetical protein Q8P59_09220, partial [Dehalococcoidia bacterium]|nr:hypothetical protein [Dehalococcoidia bacterium]
SLTTPFPGTRLWQDMVRERPEILEQDLSRAYYFNLNGKEMLPFINVSKVPDGRLAELQREAVEKFRRRQEKAWYQDRIGKPWGSLAWSASRAPMVRRLARILGRSGLVPSLPNEQEFLARRWA